MVPLCFSLFKLSDAVGSRLSYLENNLNPLWADFESPNTDEDMMSVHVQPSQYDLIERETIPCSPNPRRNIFSLLPKLVRLFSV